MSKTIIFFRQTQNCSGRSQQPKIKKNAFIKRKQEAQLSQPQRDSALATRVFLHVYRLAN